MLDRRELAGALLRPAAAAFLVPLLGPTGVGRALPSVAGRSGSPEEVADDEAFWFPVQQAWNLDRSIVNLNNGGVSPSPAVVLMAEKRHIDFSNTAPPYTMWEVLEPQREAVRQRLARHFGCQAEEIALTRNASEGLEICQYGFDLKPGDEVLTTNQDYPRMITTWQQRVAERGLSAA